MRDPRRLAALALVPLVVIGVLGAAPRAKADPPEAQATPTVPEPAQPAPAPTEPGSPPLPPSEVPPTDVPPPPAANSGTATAPAPPPPAPTPPPADEETPLGRAFVWGGTVAGVGLLSSMVLEVGVFPPVDDNGPRILLSMGVSTALGVGVGWLAAELGWPEQGALALMGAAWGAFTLAPWGVLIDGGRSTATDGLDVGAFTAGSALLGAAAFGVLSPLLLDVHEPAETIALYVAPGLGAFAGTIAWLFLWLFGAIADEPRTSSRALVASAGIGAGLGLALPFALRAFRAADQE